MEKQISGDRESPFYGLLNTVEIKKPRKKQIP